ncbi:hypothetical protein RhiJN_19140 [Ceratobasidium sp. AG-Ba]|nr:hypothetical protein RhiJN_19140 [Ceratobasidium sp. AG-Ba]
MRFSPRRQPSYEVVDVKEVKPIIIESATESVQIMRISDRLVVANSAYELKRCATISDYRHALIAARAQYMRDINPANELLCEGWKLTVMRKGEQTRLLVSYTAQPALVNGKPGVRLPPFIDALNEI